MREIKFRAISLDTGEWEYGYLVMSPSKDNANIVNKKGINEMQHNGVNTETVGQFTGLRDRNGREIYEGDIVTHYDTDNKCVIIFEAKSCMFLADEISEDPQGFGIDAVLEVIGNIHENPELL